MASVQPGDALRQIHRLFGGGTLAGQPDAELLTRFVDHRDESAFALLVKRHGPMVLGTCRAVLKHQEDAEDAFQAAFLILVRKGKSIRGSDSFGGWLHRVALRVAVQANTENTRRRVTERAIGSIRLEADPPRPEPDDLRPALHEEIARLPERYRLALVLCDLEGLTRDEAAVRLHWSEGAVRGRLARARRMLKARLVRRGLAPAAALVGTRPGAAAVVPESWAETALRVASARTAEAGAATLARSVVHAMSVSRLKALVAKSVILAAFLAVGVVAIRADGDGPPEPDLPPAGKSSPAGAKPTPADRTDSVDSIVFKGRVLRPDGNGHEGARVFLTQGLRAGPRPEVRAVTGIDGRFRFDVPRAEFETTSSPSPWKQSVVLAVAEGFGPGLALRPDANEELVLRLVEDDVPILGRVLDLQGRPVAGTRVRVLAIKTPAAGDLTPWLEALTTRRSGLDVESAFLPLCWYHTDDAPVLPDVVTAADGRFRILGIGRERLATLAIEGPAIESAQVNAMTRPGATTRVPAYRSPGAPDDLTYVGARFEHVAGPTRPIEGTVRERSTGRPLSGVIVQGETALGGNPIQHVSAITDSQGRYRLVGLAERREKHVVAIPPADSDFLRSRERIPVASNDRSTRLDIGLTRGVRVTGRVVDKLTGRPIRARVDYFVFVDNPHLEEAPGFRWAMDPGVIMTDADGSIRLVALAGPGVIAARGHGDSYLMGVGAEAIPDEDGNGILDTHPYNAVPTNYHTIALINPPPGLRTLACDLVLDPGRTLEGTMVGPEGSPLPGVLVCGLRDMAYWEHVPTATERFTLTGLRPNKPRILQFLHRAKKLAGWMQLPAGALDSPKARLEPWGVLQGRLVDEDGQPRSKAELQFTRGGPGSPPHGYLPGNGAGSSGRIVPNADGRFTIEGLAAGLPYSLRVVERLGIRGRVVVNGVTLKPGETRDLGDVSTGPLGNQDPD